MLTVHVGASCLQGLWLHEGRGGLLSVPRGSSSPGHPWGWAISRTSGQWTDHPGGQPHHRSQDLTVEARTPPLSPGPHHGGQDPSMAAGTPPQRLGHHYGGWDPSRAPGTLPWPGTPALGSWPQGHIHLLVLSDAGRERNQPAAQSPFFPVAPQTWPSCPLCPVNAVSPRRGVVPQCSGGQAPGYQG